MLADKGLNVPPLHDPAFHAGDPFPAFRRLRAEAPVHWHETPGFWALTRHEDVVAVSRDPATFCSSRGILLSDLERPIMPRQSIIYIDPPEHAKYRKLVQPAFSPGPAARARGSASASSCTSWLRGVSTPDRPVDFVDAFAAPLPMIVIADMLGVPGADRERFKRWSDAIIEAGTQPTAENMAQSVELFEYFRRCIAERRERPGDDLISAARALGDRRRAARGVRSPDVLHDAARRRQRDDAQPALARRPGARDAIRTSARCWRATPTCMPRAVEEMLRWGSPVASFMRTATRDTELRGTPIREGDRLLLLYASANRDEAVFGADAEEFSRPARRRAGTSPSASASTSASAPQLARMEARIAFERAPGALRALGARRRGRAPAVAVHPRHRAPAGVPGQLIPGRRRNVKRVKETAVRRCPTHRTTGEQ